MKQKKENSVALLLHWAGEQKFWLFLAILLSMCSGLCIIIPYIGIYRLMDATFNSACTQELVVQTVAMIAAAVTLRFVLFGCSGVAAHKGAYGALFKVRCMVAEHMARAPLGALNERRTGDIKTVLNEDIEKLESEQRRRRQRQCQPERRVLAGSGAQKDHGLRAHAGDLRREDPELLGRQQVRQDPWGRIYLFPDLYRRAADRRRDGGARQAGLHQL